MSASTTYRHKRPTKHRNGATCCSCAMMRLPIFYFFPPRPGNSKNQKQHNPPQRTRQHAAMADRPRSLVRLKLLWRGQTSARRVRCGFLGRAMQLVWASHRQPQSPPAHPAKSSKSLAPCLHCAHDVRTLAVCGVQNCSRSPMGPCCPSLGSSTLPDSPHPVLALRFEDFLGQV